MKRCLTGMIESLKILLVGKTEVGSAEAQPARDSRLKATNSRWGGSYTPAAPYIESGPFGVLQCLKKPDKIVPPKADSVSAEGRKSLLTVTWICPIHAEPKQYYGCKLKFDSLTKNSWASSLFTTVMIRLSISPPFHHHSPNSNQ